jgi:hypothetical protein
MELENGIFAEDNHVEGGAFFSSAFKCIYRNCNMTMTIPVRLDFFFFVRIISSQTDVCQRHLAKKHSFAVVGYYSNDSIDSDDDWRGRAFPTLGLVVSYYQSSGNFYSRVYLEIIIP